MKITCWTEPFKNQILSELELEAAKRFRRHQLPESADEWKRLRPIIRDRIANSLNLRIDHDLPPDPHWGVVRDLGTHTARSVWFQSRQNCYMTATLYCPKGEGPFPAIVYMHGHSSAGRFTPNYQEHANLFARHGYVTLFVDAFGSGERSTDHCEFDYHGALTGGALFSIGEPLMGLQIMDNMRAVDLLVSLDFVDSSRIGATGCSGGGNQTIYLAAFDERIKAACPVVSVGTYEAYIGVANCVCELLPGGMEICEESAILAMIAPRALMPCNATDDINKAFFVSEMYRSHTEAKKVYSALGVPEKLDSLVFKGQHSYPPKVLAAVLGFFNRHLNGDSVPYEIQPGPLFCEEIDDMLCFPRGERSSLVPSVIEYVEQKSVELAKTAHGSPAALASVLRIQPESYSVTYLSTESGWEKYTIETSRGRMLPFLFKRGATDRCVILSAPQGKRELSAFGMIGKAEAQGVSVLVFDQWATGECGYAQEYPNIWMEGHQLSRALLWFNRTLLGEWTMDFKIAYDFVRKAQPDSHISVVARRDSGLAALYAAILLGDMNMDIEMVKSPSSLIRCGKIPAAPPILADVPVEYMAAEFFTMALAIPGILKWGDIDYAVSIAPCEVKMTDPQPNDGRLRRDF